MTQITKDMKKRLPKWWICLNRQIEKYFEEIVGRNFWGYITDCRIEKVFENDNEVVLEITTQLSDILIRGVREFPYNIDISSMNTTEKMDW